MAPNPETQQERLARGQRLLKLLTAFTAVDRPMAPLDRLLAFMEVSLPTGVSEAQRVDMEVAFLSGMYAMASASGAMAARTHGNRQAFTDELRESMLHLSLYFTVALGIPVTDPYGPARTFMVARGLHPEHPSVQ